MTERFINLIGSSVQTAFYDDNYHVSSFDYLEMNGLVYAVNIETEFLRLFRNKN